MSDKDSSKLTVPEVEKETSTATERPVSPSIARRIANLAGSLSLTVRPEFFATTGTTQEAMGGTSGDKPEDGAETEHKDTSQLTEKLDEDQELYQYHIQKEVKYRLLCECFNELEAILARKQNVAEAQIQLELLETNMEDFIMIHSAYTRELLQVKLLSKFENEIASMQPLLRQRLLLRKRVSEWANVKEETQPKALTSGGTDNYRINLPRRDLPTFDGNVRQWLAYWSAFEEIHHDRGIPEGEKFQYLLQSTVEGSEARKVVTSFPASAQNYGPAVDLLRARFGNYKILKKLYVRDLLKLVVDNAQEKPSMSFSDLVTSLTSQIRNLELLGINKTDYEELLYPVVESCVPESTLEAYLRGAGCKETLDDILAFLNMEVQRKLQYSLARTPFNFQEKGNKSSGSTSSKMGGTTTTSFINGTTVEVRNCVFCTKDNHLSQECEKAHQMTLEQRQTALKEAKVCFKCFRGNHTARKCRRKVTCVKCSKEGHHYLLCRGELASQQGSPQQSTSGQSSEPSRQPPPQNGAPTAQQLPTSQSSSSSTMLANYLRRPEVLLQTLLVKVHGRTGTKTVRAMLDSGSQASYVLEDIAREIQLPVLGYEKTSHFTFGGHCSNEQTHPVYRMQMSAVEGDHLFKFDITGVKVISGHIESIPRGEWLVECQRKGITLTDVDAPPSQIEVLLGSDIVGKLLCGQTTVELSSGPVAQNTKLGWVLQGKLPVQKRINSGGAMMCVNLHCNMQTVSTLWDLEAIGISDPSESKTRKEMEEAAMVHFNSTVTRGTDGRYQVQLPWIESHPPLPTNKELAKRRLEGMTKKLILEGRLQQYDEVFKNWMAEGIIELAPEKPHSGMVHYLPHRAVYKEGSTTPLRPVFDASAKAKNSPSLNECLEKGPNLLELIPSLLIRFRMERVGVVADVKKAFLQMEVAEKDREALRFLWWRNVEDAKNIVTYRHRRVVFGVSCSPFLLGATLKDLLQQSKEYGHTSSVLQKSFYVDNLVVSVPTWEEAKQLEVESKLLLEPAHYDLRGWEYGPTEKEKVVPVLGLNWETKADSMKLGFEVAASSEDVPVTKRKILALANSVFDPLGFIAPFTLQIKLLLKRVWADGGKYGWDGELPAEYQDSYRKWLHQLKDLNQVNVPRCFGGGVKEKWELHVFCDASQLSYATCIFLRIEGDPIQVQLVLAKTRVSPKQVVTIPRLELLSCLIGARQAQGVITDMQLPNIKVTYWTDSTTAQAWIQRSALWATFVNNRVAEIRNLTNPESWKHIPGEYNPADLCSRGGSLRHLANTMWWEGPAWLKLPPQEWPTSTQLPNEEEVTQERRKTVVSSHTASATADIFSELTKFGDYHSALRIVGYAIRFRNNLMRRIKREPDNPVFENSELTAEEIEAAEKRIILHIQKSTFDGPASISGLKCKYGEDGIIRVKTKLLEQSSVFETPAVLPGRHPLVQLLIRKEHETAEHAGVSYLQSLLREKYWILKPRKSIRRVVKSCAICRRYMARRCEEEEPPLPLDRTRLVKAWTTVGVDMAGPLYVEKGRKVWVALFTCAVYRAVHIELVSNLSTQGFMEAFAKFICRRRRPSKVYSDNGRNFVGAAKIFGEGARTPLQRYASINRIDWKFSAPNAPWWGGWWERIIGLLKQLLRRVIGNKKVKQTQLEVILCWAENILNERPLTYISDDPTDLKPLTPADFIKDQAVAALPETGLVTRLRKMTKIKEELSRRFRNEYLGKLVQVGKLPRSTPLKPGDVVLVEMENQKRMDWPVGVIMELYPGIDGRIRTVKLRTKMGEVIRPIQRLFPLELTGEQEDNE